MTGLFALTQSTIGRKLLMALTGIILVGFVIAHLLGNLQLFAGPEAINSYAAFLKKNAPLLWTARTVLLATFVLHIWLALNLRQTSRNARPSAYVDMRTVRAPVFSLYMLETGLVIMAFVIFHLLHFTIGIIEPEHFHLVDAQGRHDVYSMAVHGFSHPLYSAVYCACMVALGAHLDHAIASTFQTLGFGRESFRFPAQRASRVIAWLIAVGYISIPIGVLSGIIALQPGVR